MSCRLNLLASYAYIVKQNGDYISDLISISNKVNVLIDSGGFSDYWNGIKNAALGTKIAKINIDEYIKFCHKIKDSVFGYIQLDKPRDPEASLKLLDKQVGSGLRPIPVFVQGMKWDRLQELVDINERVCISAGWQSSKEYSYQRYQQAYKITKGKIKSHALGFGKYPEILGLPIASADSSTWVNGGKYGVIKLFDKPYKLISIDRRKLKEINPSRKNMIISKLLSLNVTMEDMNDARQWHVSEGRASLTQATHTYSFLQAMKYIKQSSGIDYFIVVPGFTKSTYIIHLVACLSSILENGKLDYQLYKSELMKLKKSSNDSFHGQTLKAIDNFEYIK